MHMGADKALGGVALVDGEKMREGMALFWSNEENRRERSESMKAWWREQGKGRGRGRQRRRTKRQGAIDSGV